MAGQSVPASDMGAIPDPIQKIEQENLDNAITIDEQIQQADPQPVTAVPWQTKNELAGEIWLAAGGVKGDPLTLEHWLEAEATLNAEAPAVYNG